MHEFSIAQMIVETADRYAAQAGADRVVSVRCRIGPLRQISEWALHEAFKIARDGTRCAEANLYIEKTVMRLHCPNCQAEFGRDTLDFDCPTCRRPGRLLGGGDELELASLEAESPDPPPACESHE